MATRLPDAEFAERARAGNRQRALHRRERLARSGYQQLLVWLPADLRNQIDRIAADRGSSVTEATTIIVRAGITALAAPSLPVTLSPSVEAKSAPESLPLFEPISTGREPPLTCINADLNSLVEGGSVRGEPAKPAPGTTAERDAAIVALRRQGKSLGQIAATLAERGILTSKGNPLSRDTVNQVVKRAGLKKESHHDR